MRIPGSKIYRAFPELDSFSDQQCARFLKAVGRDRWYRRFLRLCACLATFAACLLLLWAGSWLVVASLISANAVDSGSSSWSAMAIFALITPFALSMVASMLVRDALLRRRLAGVINERGTCVSCGYLLLGVPVSDQLRVTCPECGEATEVDTSIAELAQGERGTEFRPTARVVRVRLTPEQKRRRRRKRAAVVALVAVVMLTPVWVLVWNEIALRLDARRAAAMRPGPPGLAAVVATHPAPTNGVSAWGEFAKVQVAKARVDAAEWRGLSASGTDEIVPDYSWVGEIIPENFRGSRENAEASRKLAEQMLVKLREAGVFEGMRVMRSAGDLTPALPVPAGQPLVGMLLPELAQCRELGRINKARALTALAAGNTAEFVDAMENIHVMARMCEREPFVISRLVSAALDEMGDQICKRALMTLGGAVWADAVERAQKRRAAEIAFASTLEGERVVSIDSACVSFEDVSYVRRRQMEVISGKMEKSARMRVGRLRETLTELNAAFDAQIAASRVPILQRKPSGRTEASELVLVRELLPALSKSQRSVDRVEAGRDGVATMVALERFRAVRGAYPASLAELVPGFLNSVPLDPWVGQPVCYRRLDPTSDPAGRGYVLYLRGLDKADDGGTAGETAVDALTNPKLKGIDYIVNDARYLK